MPAIATCVGARRRAAGLSQPELAALVPCSVGALKKIEIGARAPSVRMLVKLATALNCSMEDLLDIDQPVAS